MKEEFQVTGFKCQVANAAKRVQIFKNLSQFPDPDNDEVFYSWLFIDGAYGVFGIWGLKRDARRHGVF